MNTQWRCDFVKKSLNMLEGNITELILLFFLPILCGSLFQQLYNTVDAIVVGNFVGKEALAAVEALQELSSICLLDLLLV